MSRIIADGISTKTKASLLVELYSIFLSTEATAKNSEKLNGIQSTSFLRSDENGRTSGGLVIGGHTPTSATDYAGYRNSGTNLILEGDAGGSSGIFFKSTKDGDQVNHPSDYGYIQYHAQGIDGTTGEAGKLVVGVGNDAPDTLVLQTPYNNGLKASFLDAASGTGSTEHTIWHSGNDGSGSGLDADKLDGIDSSQFLRSDQNATTSGHLNSDGSITAGTSGQIATGIGSGSVAMTMNDGYGNSNLTFNHRSGTPDQDGNAGRIVVNTDESTNAAMTFEVKSGVLSGVAGGATKKMSIHDAGVTVTGDVTASTFTGLASDSAKLDGISSGSFLRSDATDYINAILYLRNDIIVESAYRNRGMFGTYDSAKTQHIWSMGTAYRCAADGSDLGNIYGLAYDYNVNGVGHGVHQVQNGTIKASIGNNIWTSGNVTAYSDIRVKENLELIPDAVAKISELNGYTYDRTDILPDKLEMEYDSIHNPSGRHVGLIAQEVLKVLPEAVTGGPTTKEGTEDEHYSVAYGNVVALLVEGIKEQQEVINKMQHDIDMLKNKEDK
jgi:hypothetical protein